MADWQNPYAPVSAGDGVWLKVNLHCHTTRSDGQVEPQRIVDLYRETGYDALLLSEHDLWSDAATLSAFEHGEMLLIPGAEVTGNGPHMLQIGGRELVAPHANRQQVIDDVRAAGGLSTFNHPCWQPHFDHCPFEVLETCQGYTAIEIVNGCILDHEGSAYALDKWDRLLSRGRRIWSIGVDDTHCENQVGRAWVMVFAIERSVAGILDALRGGCCYASTGVEITEIGSAGTRAWIETDEEASLVASGLNGIRIAATTGTRLEIDLPAEFHPYIRFTVYGMGERYAWSQPFFRSK